MSRLLAALSTAAMTLFLVLSSVLVGGPAQAAAPIRIMPFGASMSDQWYLALLSAASDTTPPTVPSGLSVRVNCSLQATLSWTASTDNVGVTGYDIFRAPGSGGNNDFVSVATTTTTTFSDRLTNVFRYEVRARDAAGNTSAFTAPVTAFPPPCPPPDTQPPTAPGMPTATVVGSTSVALAWPASTDNISVTGYDIFRSLGIDGPLGLVGASTTPTFTDTGLTPNTTYGYEVRARDAAGNTSAFSPQIAVRTVGGGCSATLTMQSAWATGYVMQPNAVTNNAATTLNGWTVTFTLPAGHTITGAWNAAVTVSGQTVTARGIPGQNATLAPGASTTWGFQATRSSGDTTAPAGTPNCTSP